MRTILRRGLICIIVVGVLGSNGSAVAAQSKLQYIKPRTAHSIQLDTVPVAQAGKASWYGPRFHGRKTSNGETFNQNDLTAAHKTLPFGTVVEVRDTTTNRAVRVRINDRGPFIKGRIIDLSKAAATALGMEQKGVTNIELRIIRG